MNFVSNGDEKWPIGWDWNRQDVGGRDVGLSVFACTYRCVYWKVAKCYE